MDFLNSLYQVLEPKLYWPGVQWKAHLIGLAISYFQLELYLNYNQYQVLKDPVPPRVLRNVITQDEYSKKQEKARSELIRDICWSLYKLVVRITLVSFNVLPFLWTLVRSESKDVLPEWLAAWLPPSVPSQRTSCAMFFLLSSLMWTILVPPTTYNEKSLLKDSPLEDPNSDIKHKTPKKWARRLVHPYLIIILCWTWTTWSIAPLLEMNGLEGAAQAIFTGYMVVLMVLSFFFIFIQPFLPAKIFDCAPLEAGRTKDAIEEIAKQFNFPLKAVYAQKEKSISLSFSDVLIWGLPWGKKIAITHVLLEKCNTEDIVALMVHYIGSWKHNIIQQPLTLFLCDLTAKLPIIFILVNWVEFCEAFSFNNHSIYPAQHPIMPILLLYSGALAPLSVVVTACVHAVSRTIEYRADKFAAQYGYGPELAKTLIKIHTTKEMNILDGDWMYSMLYNDGHISLIERLEILGWTGDEMAIPEEEGKLHDHCGTA